MNETDHDILKELFHKQLTEEAYQQLLQDQRVEREMRSQWQKPVSEIDQRVGDRIWKGITVAIGHSSPRNRMEVVYKVTAWAASILLLIGIGAYFYQKNNVSQDPQYVYVHASGIRSLSTVTLPDGSVVKMGPNSELSYPSAFDGKQRNVELKGQAFFDVAKDPNKPFIVHTSTVDVTALGTAFEVFDYESEERMETILLEGKVSVQLKAEPTGNPIILEPDKMLVYDRKSHQARVKGVNANNYSGWRTGYLRFENEKLSMILPRLEAWYGRKIECAPEIADRYRFTFKVRDESLERIFYLLRMSSPVQFREKDDEYELFIQ